MGKSHGRPTALARPCTTGTPTRQAGSRAASRRPSARAGARARGRSRSSRRRPTRSEPAGASRCPPPSWVWRGREQQLSGIGVEGDVRCADRLEGVAEEPRTTADVEHQVRLQGQEPEELSDRVVGEGPVEARGVGLLDPEGTEQAQGAPKVPPRLPRSVAGGEHPGTLPHSAERLGLEAPPTTVAATVRWAGQIEKGQPSPYQPPRCPRTRDRPSRGVLQLARHHQPRGWRLRALRRERRDCARRGRARGHSPVRRTCERPRGRGARGGRLRRRGGKLGVYPRAGPTAVEASSAPFDVVVDVQNGVPFLSRLVTRRPVVVLVHHVHREQWSVVYGRTVRADRLVGRVAAGAAGLPPLPVRRRLARSRGVSWWPRRRPRRVAVVHNGTDEPLRATSRRAAPSPCMVVLGRLVPHKRVEHALGALAALRARSRVCV